MAQSINTNLAALGVQRYLNGSQSSVTNAMTRLSSGLRINSAKDDAAGLIIGERMTAQIRGLNVASRNANDAISLVQTAESSLANVASALQRIRELAVQAANASNSDSDRATLNKEAQELIDEIKRISQNTAFNGVNLLDGSFKTQRFQVGANAGQALDIPTLADARITSLGRSAVTLDGTAAGSLLGDVKAPSADAAAGTNGITAQADLVLTNTAGSSPKISWGLGASAKDIAAAINAQANPIGVTATATNTAILGGLSATGAMSLKINGTTVNATMTSTSDLTPLADAINGAATGVTAMFANPPAKNQLKLTAADGADIRVEDFLNGTATMSVAGSKSGATVQTLTSGGTDSSIVTGSVEVVSTKGALTWAGGSADTFGTTNATGSAVLNTLSTVDIGTVASSSSAIRVIDAALDQVSNARGDLGAKQNRLEMLISNVDVVSENITAARGRLMDADFAKETAALSRAQILQQAGTAMLAQANALPQQVLQLLKG